MLIKVGLAVILCLGLAALGLSQTYYVVNQQTSVTSPRKLNSTSMKFEIIEDFSLEKGQVVSIPGDGVRGTVFGWYGDIFISVPITRLTPTKSLQVTRPKDYDFSNVYSQEWFKITETADEIGELDPSRMKKNDKVTSYWMRWVAEGQTNSMTKWEVRCATNETRLIQLTTYREKTKGKWTEVRAPRGTSPYQQFKEVTPESVGEGMLKTVCSL